MNKLFTSTILTLIALGFANVQPPKNDKSAKAKSKEKVDTIFKQISDFPIIKDSTKFIADLRQIFKLEVDDCPAGMINEKITVYKKVKMYASDKEYFFIEYEYGEGCGATFPWKYQLLLTLDGNLIKSLSKQRFEFVEIFKNENLFLLTVAGTYKGNGGHELFKISADTLENVYEGYFDYALRTYDAHQDSRIYEPNELNLNIEDYNNDGFNDIAFVGKIVFIQGQKENGDWFDSEIINGKFKNYSIDNPYKKIPIKFVFLYDKHTGHFKAKENYTEKYKLD